MKKVIRPIAVAACAALCLPLAACGGQRETRLVYELPHYDGTTYEADADAPVYNSELWRRNENPEGYADPFILDNTAIDGYYYRYGTVGTSVTNVARSSDLSYWVDCGTIANLGAGWTSFWAPEVVYEDTTEDGVDNGTYYMFFSAGFPNAESSGAYSNTLNRYSLYVATSGSPMGPFTLVDFTDAASCGAENVRTIDPSDYSYNTTYLRYALFEPIATNNAWAKIMPDRIEAGSDKMCGNIDPSPFVDPATGKKYLLFNHEAQPSPILIVEMENWLKPLIETTKVIARCGYYTVEDYERAQNGEDVETIWIENLTNKVNEGPFMYAKEQADGSYRYYLSYSVNGFMDTTYSVCQAVSDRVDGGFRKLTEAENGIMLSSDNGGNARVTGPGHHSFFHIGEKLYICYHRHTVAGNIDYGRCTAVDEVKWVTITDINGEELEVMYVNGPTSTVQPAIIEGSEYTNIAEQASISVLSGALADGSSVSWLNDGLLSFNTNLNQEFLDVYVQETNITQETTFEVTFEEFETIRGFMVYNSKHVDNVFMKIKNLEFVSEENGQEKIWYIPEMKIDENTNFVYDDFELTNGNYIIDAVTYGGGAYVEFDAIQVKAIRFTVEVPEGQSMVGLSEIAIMGKVR